MRKLGCNSKGLLFLMILICLLGAFSGCSTMNTLSQSSATTSNTKPTTPDASRSQNSAFSSTPDSSFLVDHNSEEVVAYAITLARYFCEPVDAASQLKNSPHLYEFLVNTTFLFCKTKNIELVNISSKDWLEEYLIPNETLKKTARLLLDTDLPDSFYTNPDFGYIPEKDAFQYSPFSAPMLETAHISSAKNEDGTFSVTISIAKIEQTEKRVYIYTFKPVEDAEWGLLSQLVSINDASNQ